MSELKINEFSKKYNISKITSTKIFKCLGELAESILKENPYTLKRFGGFAFKRCDEIARKIGFDMNSPIRVRACVDLAIEEIANGSTIIKTFEVMSRVSKICDIQSMDYIKKCIEKQEGDEIDYIFLNSELKPTDNNSINLWMTKSIYYNIEKYIFNMCLRASRTSVIEVNDKYIDEVERDLPFTLSKGQKEGLISFCKNNLNILTGLGGCLPSNTQVLTDKGWKEISKYNNENIMVIDPVDRNTRLGKFEKPIFRKYLTDQFYKLKTGTSFELTVSENHNNLIITDKGKNKTLTTSEMYNKWLLQEKKRKDKSKSNYPFVKIPETFQWYGEGVNYSDDYIRLKIATICDGNFNKKTNLCRVNLKKERKKIRLEKILNNLNIAYKTHKSSEGYTNYVFYMDKSDKILTIDWFFNTNKHQREVIFEEILLWDGSVDKRKNSIGRFTSTEIQTVETIQLIAQSLGYRVTISKDKREYKYRNNDCYNITFSKNKDGVIYVESADTTSFEKVEAGRYMYCFTTSTGYFLIRQNNKIYVTGNSGKSAVTKCILDILDKTKQTYTLMTPTGKSAKVLEQSTGRPVQTIHSRCLSGGDINSDWLIIDECGMCSIEHFKLIRKVLTNFHIKILFIGDINQLQPISPAQPFRDLINLIKIGKLKGNIIELSEIMRASSELFIPHLCKQFTKFLPYDSRLELKKKGELKGVEFIKKTTDINTHILDILNENNLSFENTSILLPQNKGDYGCTKINMFLQEHFNGQNEILFSDKFKIYRKNDELMHIKNNYSMDIMNGERIKLLDRQGYRYIAQKVDTLEEVIYDEETLQNETILSYCNTIHKCQGMTQDNIIIVCISSHIYMLTKQLVYTGMSRASKKLFIIYDDGILRKAYNKDVVDERKTFLGEIAKIKNK